MRFGVSVVARICRHEIAQLAAGFRCRFADKAEFKKARRPAFEAIDDKLGPRGGEIVTGSER
jgi:hypothetical protein